MLTIIFLCFSVVFFVLAFLIKKKKMYGLFLGYDSLSFLQKKNILIEKVAGKISFSFMIIAIIFLICAFSSYHNLTLVYSLLILFVFVIYFPYILISIQRFDYNTKPSLNIKRAKRSIYTTIIILLIIILIILIGVYLTVRPAKIVLLDTQMQIRGVYGQNILYSEIEDMSIRDYLEDTKERVSGMSFLFYSKGTYMLEDLGETKLFVKRGSSSYIYMKLKDRYVIINRNSKEKTKELFENIFTKWRINK